MPSPSIVPAIDRSDSMRMWNYFSAAQTDAATFVNIMNPGDSLAVVGFSDTASVSWPSNGQLQKIRNQQDQTAATVAIEAMTTLNLTNIKEAISLSHSLVTTGPTPRGIVLLSDGLWTAGGDPLSGLPTDVPIYTIALGPNGQQAVLQSIAAQTGGTYHYTPDPLGLAEIYNSIAATSKVAALLANERQEVPAYHFKQVFAPVQSGVTEATFGVNWTNSDVRYTSGTPTGNQVNVSIYDPQNQRVTATPIYDGDAFVVFKVPNPVAGQWSALAWYSGSSSLNATVGVFSPADATQVTISMQNQNAKRGQPIPFEVRLEGINDPVVHASVEAPQLSFEQMAEHHRHLLADIEADPAHTQDGMPEVHSKLVKLQQRSGDPASIVPRAAYPATFSRTGDNTFRGEIQQTDVAGSYTVRVNAHDNNGQTPVVSRPRLASVVVSE